jgi:hypothetical protein
MSWVQVTVPITRSSLIIQGTPGSSSGRCWVRFETLSNVGIGPLSNLVVSWVDLIFLDPR